jgi:hypothetical protein
MEMPKNSVELLLEELNKEGGEPIISREEYSRAEKEINQTMEAFSVEQRAYFSQSIQSASKAYLTF